MEPHGVAMVVVWCCLVCSGHCVAVHKQDTEHGYCEGQVDGCQLVGGLFGHWAHGWQVAFPGLYGIDMGVAYNKPTEHKSRIPICPVAKEMAILDALKAFRMLAEDTEYKEADVV